LAARHRLVGSRVHVVTPGADPAPLAPGTDGMSRLLCVASVIPRKGQDLLVDALADIADLPWRCECVGPLLRDPDYVGALGRSIAELGFGDRVRLVGPRTGERLAATYAAADLVVLPSRAETYGMVVTEALARGIPVLATEVDGVPDTLGRDSDGGVPGMLIRPEDPQALAEGLRRWFAEHDLRRVLRTSARRRRGMLSSWDETARRMAAVLGQLPD
jgi:glycosyltransferase involved in cell wall biosynthesis